MDRSVFTPLRGRVRPHQGYKVSYVVVVVVVVSRYMHTSLMGVVLTSPYIPTSTLWLKE